MFHFKIKLRTVVPTFMTKASPGCGQWERYKPCLFLVQLFLFFPLSFALSAFADQQEKKMNASLSTARVLFSHLLQSRFHIKLVIACDPARHNSYSGGLCYMDEILWNANIYAHTFPILCFSHYCIYFCADGRAGAIDISNYTRE